MIIVDIQKKKVNLFIHLHEHAACKNQVNTYYYYY